MWKLLSWFQLRLGMFVSSSWKVILPDRIPSAKHLVVPSKWFSWEILTRSVLYGREVTCAKPHGNDAGLQISSVVPPVSCKPSKPLPSYGSSKQQYSFQNSLLAAVAAAALCLIVYYCHEKHLCHPHLGAPPKWDSCTTKMGQDHPSRHYK